MSTAWFSRNWGKVAFPFVLGAVGWGIFTMMSKEKEPFIRPRQEMTFVDIVPPPPPPPTRNPPPEPRPREEPQQQQSEMLMQEEITEADLADESADADAGEDAGPVMGTGILGDGDDGFGLGRRAGPVSLGGSGRAGGGAASRFGRYAVMVQGSVGDALRANPATRSARFLVEVRIWTDANGLVTQAQLVESTGDPRLDRILQDEILTGLRLRQPPPEDMPMPIVLRLTARPS